MVRRSTWRRAAWRRSAWRVAALAALLVPAPALAGPAHQLFVEANLLWTFGGAGHFGLGVGAHYSVLVFRGNAPDVGAYTDLRWVRLRGLSASFGTRLGAEAAWWSGGGGYQPVYGADAEVGWTVRTAEPSGLRVGGGVDVLFGQLRLDALVWIPNRQPPGPAPDGTLPIPAWTGSGAPDLTLSLGGQLWVIPQYDVFASVPPPDAVITMTGTTTTE